MNQHYIGQPVLYSIKNSPADLGTIVNIQETSTDPIYTVRRLAGPEEPTVDGWTYNTITDDQIIKLNNERPTPLRDKWAIEHQKEINQAFGEEFGDYACLIVYDDLSQMIDDGFEDYINDEHFCRRIMGKWVFWAA